MAECYMMAAGAGRRTASYKQVTKLLDTQIDQALVYVQTKDIDNPAVYNTTCLTLARHIETAIAMNAVPSPSHLPKLLLIVKEVYIRKAGMLDSSLMTLLIHIKSACQAGWYTDKDKDCLLIMVDKATMGHYNLDIRNDEPTDAQSVSEIISRFYPRMKVELILASFDVKAGDGPSEAEFYIAPNTLPDQSVWLLVARTDNMDTATCLTSPSNVDFLINDSEVPNRTRRKMGKGAQLPTNVTKMVKDGANRLQVIGEFDGEYVIAVAIMSLISSPYASQLQDYVHPMSENDCSVTNGHSRILLDCPISGLRIRTPVKGHLCTHSQCFDYNYFMEANFMRPLWKCPVAHCNRPICNLDIRIDQAFLKILNEVADDVGYVYISDDGSWRVSLTEKSQIHKDTVNQQNHVPGDTEDLASLEANATPIMSSLELQNIGGSSSHMTVECASTFEQPSVTTPGVSLEGIETPPMSSSALHNIGSSVIQCPTFEQPTVPMNAVSSEANETPPMSSSALHNIGSSVIQCPTFEQPTVPMPAVSSEANEIPRMSSALHNIGGFVIDSLMMPQNHVPGDSEDLASLEANETPIMSSLALHNVGGSAINTPVKCTYTVEQPSVTTPAVSLEANETPHTSSSALHDVGGSVIQCPSTSEQPAVTMPAVSLEANETPPMSSSALHDVGGSVIQCPSTSEQPTVTIPAVSLKANETPPMSSSLHDVGDFVIECPSTFEQRNVTTPAVTPPQIVKDSLSMPQILETLINMAPKFVTLLCYWDGAICDGPEGVFYNKSPSKAIKVQCGIRYDELIDQIHSAMPIDKQQHHIKVICRYPTVAGKVMKYIPLHINDDKDVEIMFDVLNRHKKLSNIDLYIEVEDTEPRCEEMAPSNCTTNNSVMVDEERSNDVRHINVVEDMIRHENFTEISKFAVVNNEMCNKIDITNEVDADDTSEEGEEEDEPIENYQVSSNFTSFDEVEMATVDNWTVTHPKSINDFTRELEKDCFKDKEELIRAIKLHTIKTHKHFEVVETSTTLWRIRCKHNANSGCKWQVRACKRKRSGFFEITKYIGPHTCLRSKITQDHPNLDANLIAQEIQHLVKEQPSISIPALTTEIVNKLGYTPSYKKVWTGKNKAIERVFGNWDESYMALPKFLAALQSFNPGTIVELSISRPNDTGQVELRRVFWAFAPSIKGFRHCRPVISIDATHLYGKYNGKLMIAMGVDGNNQILPLAFGIAENESNASWFWFLSNVKKHVVKEREGICLISDGHGGILKVVNEQGSPWLEPHAFHRYCLRHFVNSFNDKFCSPQLKALAYRAGSQTQVRKFNSIMEEIGRLNPQARQWLEGHPLAKWTLAHDGGKRYGLLTTNLSEIFNSVLKGARFLPITECVQLTFYRLVHYFNVRRPLGSGAQANEYPYVPQVVAKLAASTSKSSAHSLRSFNREKGIFEVLTHRKQNVQVVNLENKTCACGKWEVFKYPCSHVLSTCANISLDSWQYVHRCYSIVEYSATWASEFSPLPHEAHWPESSIPQLLPNSDLKRKSSGRPRSTRLRNGMDIKEGKKRNLCGTCKNGGHNKKTCPSKPK